MLIRFLLLSTLFSNGYRYDSKTTFQLVHLWAITFDKLCLHVDLETMSQSLLMVLINLSFGSGLNNFMFNVFVSFNVIYLKNDLT